MVVGLVVMEAGSDWPGHVRAPVRLDAVRSQVAVVRARADQVEQLSREGQAEALCAQLVEELARLGCRLLEEAGSLTSSVGPEDSGVYSRGESESRQG